MKNWKLIRKLSFCIDFKKCVGNVSSNYSDDEHKSCPINISDRPVVGCSADNRRIFYKDEVRVLGSGTSKKSKLYTICNKMREINRTVAVIHRLIHTPITPSIHTPIDECVSTYETQSHRESCVFYFSLSKLYFALHLCVSSTI